MDLREDNRWLQRVGEPGNERPVAVIEGVATDLTSLTADIGRDFLVDDGIARARAAFDELPIIDIAGRRVGAPIARPQAVWCIGLNYAAHAAESGVALSGRFPYLAPADVIQMGIDSPGQARQVCTQA